VTVIYSPAYQIDIGTHVFPTRKYGLVYERIASLHPNIHFVHPPAASWDELALVHTLEYLRKARTGDFELAELAQLEVPWTPEVMEGFRLMTGGTILAARLAAAMAPSSSLRDPSNGKRRPVCVFHVGGGFHHAFSNHGEGFCLFNDVAVATRMLLASHVVQRIAIIDLDVHHGNGTALIFEREPRVFTLSMHQQHNYPAFKPASALDIGLPDGATDTMYLQRLAGALENVAAFDPQLVFYLAGADPFEDDQLGGLALTKAGLRERDRAVLRMCYSRSTPVVIVLAGGYARKLEDTVDIHCGTFEEAVAAT
jgi:acetoin utilization deacetylase AcuC-like enzyme